MNLCALPHRSVLALQGDDALSLMQGIITQDIRRLEAEPIIYSLLLSPQGKFQYDLFLWHQNDILYIDTDRQTDLENLLKRYTLRRDVTISRSDLKIYAAFGDTSHNAESLNISKQDVGSILFQDPRHQNMGQRIYSDSFIAETGTLSDYDKHRLNNHVIDGSRDMTIDRSIPLEWNMDHHHAISWDKGCYIGQELTSRTKHLGLIKKRIQILDDQALTHAASNPNLKYVKSYGHQHLCFMRHNIDEGM